MSERAATATTRAAVASAATPGCTGTRPRVASCQAWVTRSSMATASPNGRAGTRRTIRAATGAASTPPTSMATSGAGSTALPPRALASEPTATIATATSAAFAEPTASLGARPRCRRAGVTTGPQVPTRPLVTPPTSPAAANPGPSALAAPAGMAGAEKRTRMRSPARASTTARAGRSASPSTTARMVVPMIAPAAPGTASRATTRRSTFPSRQ